jgi:hypothetical protein
MDKPPFLQQDLFLTPLRRFHDEVVNYVLAGGQAVRLSGPLRATEGVDIPLYPSRPKREKAVKALNFLTSSLKLDPAWFESRTI